MGKTSSIGGEGVSKTPSTEATDPTHLGPSQGSISNALHTPVSTLGELKAMLIKNLGEEKGKKMYNSFIQSFSIQMLSQLQQSSSQAAKAARKMRQDTSG